MAITHFQGMEIHTNGELPQKGEQAPDFTLVKNDLSDLSLLSLRGKKVVLNIFPSIDTGICATSVRKFNEKAANCANTEVLCISKDLPFAQGRFCGAENLQHVTPLSDFRMSDFVKNYGILLTDGPLAGLLARAVITIDETGTVLYAQLVNEITEEPDYDKALASL